MAAFDRLYSNPQDRKVGNLENIIIPYIYIYIYSIYIYISIHIYIYTYIYNIYTYIYISIDSCVFFKTHWTSGFNGAILFWNSPPRWTWICKPKSFWSMGCQERIPGRWLTQKSMFDIAKTPKKIGKSCEILVNINSII
jgi:hypothetical protein